MNRPTRTARLRLRLQLGMLAVAGLLVLATSACSAASTTTDAVGTSQKLSQQGYVVDGLESRPNDNLLAKVTVLSGQSLDGVASTTAKVVWGAMPVRITTLDVEANGAGKQVAKHFTRAQLEQTYGARPAGLDQDVTVAATNVAMDVLKVGALILAALAAIAAAVVLIVIRMRRRTTSQQ